MNDALKDAWDAFDAPIDAVREARVTVSAEAYYLLQQDYEQAQAAIDRHHERLTVALADEKEKTERLTKENDELRKRLEIVEGELAAAASRGVYR